MITSTARSRLRVCGTLLAALSLFGAACGGDATATTAPSTTAAAAEEAPDDGDGDATATTAPSTTAAAAEEAPEVDRNAPDTLRVLRCGGAIPNLAVLLAADGMGLYDQIEQDFGTTVEFVDIGGGGDCVSSFVGGAVDMGSIAFSLVANMGASAQDAVEVFNGYDGGGIIVVGAQSLVDERGTDITAWDGSSWGYTSEGSATQVWIRAAIEDAGLSWEDQEGIPLGSITALVPALQAGQVDGFGGSTAEAVSAVNLGIGSILFNSNSEEAREIVGSSQLGLASLFTSSSFAEEYPGLTQAMVTAQVEALQGIQENIDDPDAVLALFTPEVQELFSQNWADVWELTSPAFDGLTGGISAEALNGTIAFAKATGTLAPEDVVPDSVADNTFVLQAYEDLGLDAPDGIEAHPTVEE